MKTEVYKAVMKLQMRLAHLEDKSYEEDLCDILDDLWYYELTDEQYDEINKWCEKLNKLEQFVSSLPDPGTNALVVPGVRDD